MKSVLNVNGDKIKLTASFGAAALREGEPPISFIDRADQALYHSKKLGRNLISTEEDLD